MYQVHCSFYFKTHILHGAQVLLCVGFLFLFLLYNKRQTTPRGAVNIYIIIVVVAGLVVVVF